MKSTRIIYLIVNNLIVKMKGTQIITTNCNSKFRYCDINLFTYLKKKKEEELFSRKNIVIFHG